MDSAGVVVVVVSGEVGSGIESGPSPGVHAPTSITPTIATLFQRTCSILPDGRVGSRAKTLVLQELSGVRADTPRSDLDELIRASRVA